MILLKLPTRREMFLFKLTNKSFFKTLNWPAQAFKKIRNR